MSTDVKNGQTAQENFINQRKAMEVTRLKSIEDSFYLGVVTQYKENTALLPESIFVKDFLPYFCGERNVEDNPEFLPMWFAVAGSPTSEVRIINNNREVLFVVPPVIDTTRFDPTYNKDRNKMSIDDIENMSNQLARTIPARGTRYRDEAWSERMEEMANVDHSSKDLETRWYNIFLRYGKIVKKDNSDNKAANPAMGKSDISDDDLEF